MFEYIYITGQVLLPQMNKSLRIKKYSKIAEIVTDASLNSNIKIFSKNCICVCMDLY